MRTLCAPETFQLEYFPPTVPKQVTLFTCYEENLVHDISHVPTTQDLTLMICLGCHGNEERPLPA